MGILRKDSIINLSVATFCTVILAVIVGYTYSFFQVEQSNNTVIAGEAESMNMSLEVKKVSSGNGKLIPQMGEYILSAVQGRNGSCVDDNNNTVCQVYKITLQNKGSSSIMVNGTVELDNKNNPNLKWTTISDFTEGVKPALSGVSRTADNTILTTNEEYTAGQTKNYYIVVWINETGLSQTDTGIFNGVVNFKNTDGTVEESSMWNTETPIDSSNANIPTYANGLVPVMYDTTTSNWVVADTTSSTSTYGWYDYDAKKWANAVLVTDDKRESLTTDSNGYYTPGQSIGDTEDEGVLAFYVWIPRYKYEVWDINKVAGTSEYTYDAYTKGVNIEFEEGTSTTGGITCNYSFVSSGNEGEPYETCSDSGTEGYYTHPAFKFGNDQLTGFWMGKFELSSSTPTASNGGGTSITLIPRILPNVVSWGNNPVDNFWLVINNMQTNNNIYGLSTDRTNTDSHMLTNIEWGAVAYLTHSEYGRCENETCTEVARNDSSGGTYPDHITYTGRSSGGEDDYNYSEQGTYTYEETNGQLASTTGNIYGVYDMSGGVSEYVMANSSSVSGRYEYNLGNVGGNYIYGGFEKYITTYANATSIKDYSIARLGDATSEVVLTPDAMLAGGWYEDRAEYFGGNSWPWLYRGATAGDGIEAGVFCFAYEKGRAVVGGGTRAALVGF